VPYGQFKSSIPEHNLLAYHNLQLALNIIHVNDELFIYKIGLLYLTCYVIIVLGYLHVHKPPGNMVPLFPLHSKGEKTFPIHIHTSQKV